MMLAARMTFCRARFKKPEPHSRNSNIRSPSSSAPRSTGGWVEPAHVTLTRTVPRDGSSHLTESAGERVLRILVFFELRQIGHR